VSVIRRQYLALAILAAAVFAPLALPQPSAAIAPVSGASYHAASVPTRIADTRASGGFTRISSSEIAVPVRGRGGVPETATVAVLTVTATNTAAAGFVTVWPSGDLRPNASNLNPSAAGQTVANTAPVLIGADGAVKLYTSAGADLLVDLAGWFEPATATTSGRFVSVEPLRAMDTRRSSPLRSGETRALPLATFGVPPDAAAVVVNLTMTNPVGPGFLTVWPAGQPRPNTSAGNVDAPDQTRAVLAVVPTSAAGLSIFASVSTDVLVDVVGFFTGASSPLSSDGLFLPSLPVRVLDTRSEQASAPLYPNGVIEVPVTGAAVWANVTSVPMSGSGYASVFAARTDTGGTSTLNFDAGQVAANSTISRVSAAGLAIRGNGSTQHLIVDSAGTFTGSAAHAASGSAVNDPPPLHLRPRSVAWFSDSIGFESRSEVDAVLRGRGVGSVSYAGFPGTAPCDYMTSMLAAAGKSDVVMFEFSGNRSTACMSEVVADGQVAARFELDARRLAGAYRSSRSKLIVVLAPEIVGSQRSTKTAQVNSMFRRVAADEALAVIDGGALLKGGGAWPQFINGQQARSGDGVHLCPTEFSMTTGCPTASYGASLFAEAVGNGLFGD
jgi:hypothetical protein